MTKTIYYFFFAFLVFSSIQLNAQCEPGESTVLVTIHTDSWGYETSWRIEDQDGNVYYEVLEDTYGDAEYYETEVCIPSDVCVTFTIEDSYGDGIFHEDGYVVEVDGVVVGMGGTNFTNFATVDFNCPAGTVCSSALEISEGTYVAEFEDSWFTFTPDSTGIYLISTCDDNACDTKIWVYDDCFGTFDESNEGTLFYNDNNPNCDELAEVEGFFGAGTTYVIRIGDANDDCDESINFSVNYLGPVIGCMDETSCNFNPLATIDDGSCIPWGDPDCPSAPDLVLRQDVLETSIYLTTLNATDDCLINEGCLNGFGMRDIIRFTTHIENNGDADYFIGEPTGNPDQFTYDNCHNHYHYDGYAEYILFDTDGTELPIGFKNGFCVLDLTCDNGGSAQYGCGYMGITAGCGDIYSSGLECQWIDVTDVPDGFYTFVTRVNWDNAPDALGRVETDTLNNWGQVCINLDRSSGTLEFELVDDCPDYVDCAGTPYGNAQPDCNGDCGGTALMGDLNGNEVQEMEDSRQYVDDILIYNIAPTQCNDLNADDAITVYDAALLASCLNYGTGHNHTGGGFHDHCDFPSGVLNPADTVSLSIMNYNPDEQYLDISIHNPTASVVAYQFNVSGVALISAENLVDPAEYPILPKVNLTDGMAIGISYEDSLIMKSNTPQALVRLHYSELTDTLICISNIVDIVSQEYHQVVTRIDGPCLTIVDTDDLYINVDVKVEPNPFAQQTRISFLNGAGASYQLEMMNATGQVIRTYTDIRGNGLTIDRDDLPSGVYMFNLRSEGKLGVGKLVIQ